MNTAIAIMKENITAPRDTVPLKGIVVLEVAEKGIKPIAAAYPHPNHNQKINKRK